MNRGKFISEGWGVIFLVPALGLCGYLYFNIPFLQTIPLCGAKHFLGVDCPGCGMTTSISALINGHIRESIDAHPLGIVIFVWLIYMFGRGIYFVIFKRYPRPLLSQKQRDLLMYTFLFALIFQWIVKLALG